MGKNKLNSEEDNQKSNDSSVASDGEFFPHMHIHDEMDIDLLTG